MLDKLEELTFQANHLFSLEGLFQGFSVFQVHLCSLCLGLSLPRLVLFCFYDLLIRGAFRTLSNIQDGAFCENS